jgi:hypothetical protein
MAQLMQLGTFQATIHTLQSMHTETEGTVLLNADLLLFPYSRLQGFAVDHLSGWFCFVQTSEGRVVSVFHSRTEDSEAVTFKKGIAAAFQANFRGTFEETEIDTNSKHLSHYRFVQPASL